MQNDIEYFEARVRATDKSGRKITRTVYELTGTAPDRQRP